MATKFDPGLTEQYTAELRRVINSDGSFNVRRRGATWRDINPYLYLVSTSWPRFFVLQFWGYFAVNVAFAFAYFLLGPDSLQGGPEPDTPAGRFLNAFYFSSHTLTTVGFGSISPKTSAANVLAAFEALVGLLGFAVATGLLYGRVSKPNSRIAFSEQALVSPYRSGTSLQFRVLNRRTTPLMELEASILLMTVVSSGGVLKRQYDKLQLERERVHFLPLTWTIVHPIDRDSPLCQLTPEDLKQRQAEIMILIKAWDETFSQTVHRRYSYRYDEIVWDARFTPAFDVGGDGHMTLNLDRLSAYQKL